MFIASLLSLSSLLPRLFSSLSFLSLPFRCLLRSLCCCALLLCSTCCSVLSCPLSLWSSLGQLVVVCVRLVVPPLRSMFLARFGFVCVLVVLLGSVPVTQSMNGGCLSLRACLACTLPCPTPPSPFSPPSVFPHLPSSPLRHHFFLPLVRLSVHLLYR